MVKKGYCKICALNPIIVRLLEDMLLNVGHRNPEKPCRPLTYEQIAHVIYVVFDVSLGRKTIAKHFHNCMRTK